jgi:serine/threonine protein kinase
MHRHLKGDAQRVARFEQQPLAAARVRHASSVEVRAVSTTDDGTPLVVMELLRGETLETRTERSGRLSLGCALQVGERLLGFLCACHAAGVVHRALEPSKVFLLRQGVRTRANEPETWMKVLDLGVPRSADADPSADLAAVGAILFRALIGLNLRDWLDRLATRTSIADAARLPPELARVIDGAFAIEPRSAESMLSELRASRATFPATYLDQKVSLRADDDSRVTSPSSPAAVRIQEEERAHA